MLMRLMPLFGRSLLCCLAIWLAFPASAQTPA